MIINSYQGILGIKVDKVLQGFFFKSNRLYYFFNSLSM